MGELFLAIVLGVFLTPIYPVELLMNPTAMDDPSDQDSKYAAGFFLELAPPPLADLSTKHKNSALGLVLERSMSHAVGLRLSLSGIAGDQITHPSTRFSVGVPLTIASAKNPWTIWGISADEAVVFFRPEVGCLNYALKNYGDEHVQQFSYGAFLGTGYKTQRLWFQIAYGYRAHTGFKDFEPRNGGVFQADFGVAF